MSNTKNSRNLHKEIKNVLTRILRFTDQPLSYNDIVVERCGQIGAEFTGWQLILPSEHRQRLLDYLNLRAENDEQREHLETMSKNASNLAFLARYPLMKSGCKYYIEYLLRFTEPAKILEQFRLCSMDMFGDVDPATWDDSDDSEEYDDEFFRNLELEDEEVKNDTIEDIEQIEDTDEVVLESESEIEPTPEPEPEIEPTPEPEPEYPYFNDTQIENLISILKHEKQDVYEVILETLRDLNEECPNTATKVITTILDNYGYLAGGIVENV